MVKFNFYTVIIGTELLNGRRADSHFNFVNQELLKRDWEHKGSFLIDDDPALIERIYNLIKDDPTSVLFSFGGIGATPDDKTREVSGRVFTNESLKIHQEALEKIEKRFKEIFKEEAASRLEISGRAMAELPVGAEIVENPYNQIPGYSLEGRFFFLPGFPEMAHPMVVNILDEHFLKGNKKFRKTITVYAGEGCLIDIMREIPENIETSSLPSVEGKTVFSLSSYSEDELIKWFEFSKKKLEEKNIEIGVGK